MLGYEPYAVATFLAFVFVVLFLCIVVYLKVPRKIASFLDQRALLIGRELDDARRLRMEALALLEDYKTRTKNAEAEAQAILDQAKDDATRLRDEAQAALKDMVDRRTKAATIKISLAETQAIARCANGCNKCGDCRGAGRIGLAHERRPWRAADRRVDQRRKSAAELKAMPLAAFAPAKINLYLHVHGRYDDGYHALESLVAFADYGDALTLEAGKAFHLRVEGAFAHASGADKHNLVSTAAALFLKQWPQARSGAFTLTKNIPGRSGTGGRLGRRRRDLSPAMRGQRARCSAHRAGIYAPMRRRRARVLKRAQRADARQG